MSQQTAAERQHVARVIRCGCVVCLNNNFEDSPAECHHIRTGITGAALRSTWHRVLPLCPIHHRQGDGTATFAGELGYHVSPEEWELRYGCQEDLLVQVLRLIGSDPRESRFKSQVIEEVA